MFNIERVFGWLLTMALVGAIAWSVTGFINGSSVASPSERNRETVSIEVPLTQGLASEAESARPEARREVSGPQAFGDDSALDGLWLACEAGDGEACDRLFEVAPVGSDYELFGLSCGDRPLVLDCEAELGES